ncbi:MAG: hypothetical protein KatS3mg102_0732 [Planctomycetota bacterium]|nr:MAG: hypothetical protein KatS3mg102_0732 [Planctomycetota bacterium]
MVADTLVQQAISGVLPRATLFTRYTRDSEEVSFGGSSFTPQERFEYYFRLQQPLLEGRLLPALDLAAATRRIERLRLREARDRLLFAVAAEFYGVLALEHDLAALELAHRHAAEQLRVLEVQERAGEAPRQQVLLMQARRDQVQAELHRTAQERLAARARLERLLGIELGERALADTYEVRSVPGALPELLEQGYAERPDLQAAAAAIEEAKARERLVWAEYLPKISLEWTHWTHMEGGFNAQIDWTLGVLGEWTLFDGGGREARLAQARSEVRQRELELAARRKQVRQEISEAPVRPPRAGDVAPGAREPASRPRGPRSSWRRHACAAARRPPSTCCSRSWSTKRRSGSWGAAGSRTSWRRCASGSRWAT